MKAPPLKKLSSKEVANGAAQRKSVIWMMGGAASGVGIGGPIGAGIGAAIGFFYGYWLNTRGLPESVKKSLFSNLVTPEVWALFLWFFVPLIVLGIYGVSVVAWYETNTAFSRDWLSFWTPLVDVVASIIPAIDTYTTQLLEHGYNARVPIVRHSLGLGWAAAMMLGISYVIRWSAPWARYGKQRLEKEGPLIGWERIKHIFIVIFGTPFLSIPIYLATIDFEAKTYSRKIVFIHESNHDLILLGFIEPLLCVGGLMIFYGTIIHLFIRKVGKSPTPGTENTKTTSPSILPQPPENEA